MNNQNFVDEDETLFRPIYHTSKTFYSFAAALAAIVLFGIFMYIRQLIFGLGVTGMNVPVSWGFYIISFLYRYISCGNSYICNFKII